MLAPLALVARGGHDLDMAAKKKTPPPTTTVFGTATATRVLASLPALDDKRRALYRKVFTDLQCHAWGRRTRAKKVVSEANQLIGSLGALFQKREVVGYAKHRLAWLCELTLALASAVEKGEEEEAQVGTSGKGDARTAADRLLSRIVDALLSAGEGDEVTLKRLSALEVRRDSNARLTASLQGVAALASDLRATEDGRLLCEDVGLTAAVLAEVKPLVERLEDATMAVMRRPPGTDAPDTNVLEGRVLREMAFATSAIRRAKALDSTVPLPPYSKLLSGLMHHGSKKKGKAPRGPGKATHGEQPG